MVEPHMTLGADVLADLEFKEPSSEDEAEKPYEIRCVPPNGMPERNFKSTVVPKVPICNMRPLIPCLSLDVQGFLVADLKSQLQYEEFFVEERLKAVFAEEVRSYLLDSLGASRVFFHECVIRQTVNGQMGTGSTLRTGYGQPATRIHGDYTLYEVTKLFGQLGGATAAGLIKGRRYQALNIWKPLRGPVLDWPLAVCDLRTVDEKDMIPFDEVYADDVLESYQVHYNAGQRWYYLSNQMTTEMLVFKSADSEIQGTVPHGAFQHPLYANDPEGRQSIELRALVVY
ncbi:hypothetical protein BJX99DRAFT_226210 [Aspergillus californicus]